MAKDANGNWFKRHKILTVILGLFVLIIMGTALGGGSDGDKTSKSEKSDSSSKKVDEPKVIGLNQAARDGKFEFTVTGLTCGKISVGSEYLSKAPQGQFCMLNVTVKNIGDEAQSLFSSNQFLLNDKGQKYSADDTATMYNNPDPGTTWYNDINPGNTVSGTIVFDIPKDQNPTIAQLHDSALSGGVKVKLQ